MRTLPILMTFLATACTVGATDGLGDDDDDGPDPDPSTGEISGTIRADQTWSGDIAIVGETTIEAGATVTVQPGTNLTAKNGVTLRVHGALDVAGTAAAPVTMLPTADSTTWAGIVAHPGGSVRLAYAEGGAVASLLYCHAGAALCHLDHVEFTGLSNAVTAEGPALIEASRIVDIANGGLTIRGEGSLTVRDSYVLTSSGDLIVQNGGTLIVEYSEIGDTQGTYDHCNFHINAGTVSITRTNIVNGVVAMMLGGTNGAVIQYNNWLSNESEIAPVGPNTAVDARYNYWEAGAPADLGADYDVGEVAAAPIADAGPRL
jgi:hypothetical protein